MHKSDEADAKTENAGLEQVVCWKEGGLAEEMENICDRALGNEFESSLNTNHTLTV